MSQLNGISAVLKAYPALLGGKNVHIVSCTNRTDLNSRKNLAHIKNGETGYWRVAKERKTPIRKGDVVVVVMSPTGETYPKDIYCGKILADIEGITNIPLVFPVSYVNRKKPVVQVNESLGIERFLEGATCPRGNNVNSISRISISDENLAMQKTSEKLTFEEFSKFLVDPNNCKEGEVAAIKELLANPDITSTVKIQLGLARVGQGKFRKGVLARAKYCDVTGFNDPAFLLASHILPWAKCTTGAQRLDANNGLLLTPNFDRLFDKGLISFDQDGFMLSLPKHLPVLLQLAPSVFDGTNKLRIKPNSKQQEYLKQHREIFELQDALHVFDIPRRKARTKNRRRPADAEFV